MRNRCDDQRAGWTLRGLSNVKIMFLYFYSFSRWLCLRSTNWWCLSLNYKSYFSFLWMKIEPSAPYRVIRKSQYPSWWCVCVCRARHVQRVSIGPEAVFACSIEFTIQSTPTSREHQPTSLSPSEHTGGQIVHTACCAAQATKTSSLLNALCVLTLV